MLAQAPGYTQATRFKYTGREDDGLGLYYYRARYYNPSQGRFISEDPIGLAGGVNLYAYVSGNPISKVDPRGLWQIYVGGDIDLIGITGFELSGGFVVDFSNLMNTGFFAGTNFGVGANVGAGLGAGFICREIGGKGGDIDLNAGPISPTIYYDGQGFNGIGLAVGPGIGGDVSGGSTGTLTLQDVVNFIVRHQ